MTLVQSINKTLVKIFGSRNERVLRSMQPLVAEVASYEEPLKQLSDEQLRAKSDEFRDRLSQGTALDDLLPESFAGA